MNNALNNALNLFPTTTGPQQTQVKLQKLLYSITASRGPTEIQSTLAYPLFDDSIEYMNTLDMNRAASYTFGQRNSYGQNGTTTNILGGDTNGESIANEMWELVVDLTLGKFTQHSVLALTKTIHLIQHVLVHGSEACVMNGELLYRIEMAVEPLRNLNTALVEQQMVEQILNNEGKASGLENDIVLSTEGIAHQFAQLGTRASAAMMKIRGGSVDKGHPVRVAASNLYGIVSIPDNLKKFRLQQAPPGSLVPIGSTKQVGYITDEGRYRLLQEKMAAEEKELKQKQWQEEQRLKQTRSNLAGKSAIDSFGGGYAASAAGNGGKVVVGAANSLEDMIKSAKYELEQHKQKQKQKISSLKQGYSDDPYTREQQLKHMEQNSVESDPEFRKKEKALQDALEYLEEMQKLEQEKVGDLLEGDLLGGADANNEVADSGGSGAADLLGFDINPPAPTSSTDVFGGTVTSGTAAGGGGSADLLGFDGLATPAQPQTLMGNNLHASMSNSATLGGVEGVMGANTNFGMRPSLVTGSIRGDTENNDSSKSSFMGGGSSQHGSSTAPIFGSTGGVSTMGGLQGTANSSFQPELDEEAVAEKSRKMQMAAGLFAGVVPSDSSTETSQRKPIMQSSNSSNISALDELIPTSEPLGQTSAAYNTSTFDSNDLNSSSMPPLSTPASSDPFGMAPMGGNSTDNSIIPPPMPSMAPPPPPSMAPPLPPTEPPPPPPPSAQPVAGTNPAPNVATNNMLGNNPSVEQMQQMIQQQQQQMQQMMQMMQQMQMQGGSTGAGGWPPS